uniref:Si:ch211-66i15.4 n=1 Tax=Labrus bergylta TaxID=56723 RepID=A0A3Q3F363_9LABR
MSVAPTRRISFGSSQERRLFPVHHAPDRLGNEMSRQPEPHMGPGCYDNHEFGTILYDLQKTPESKRGYVISARTATRFPPCNKVHEPHRYYTSYLWYHSCTEGTSNRMMFMLGSSPGTYAPDAVTNRKVTWPMCFGSPDWSRLPQLEKNSTMKEEFSKHRSRVAYLSLYY